MVLKENMVTMVLTLWSSRDVGVFMDLKESWEAIEHVQMNMAKNTNTIYGLHAPNTKMIIFLMACYIDEIKFAQMNLIDAPPVYGSLSQAI